MAETTQLDIMPPKIANSTTVSIDTLQLWDRNPRSIKSDRFNELKERLKRQGQIKPLLVAKDGTTVIGGNMRLRAMQELGINEVWISQTEAVTDKEIFDLALTDNEEFGYYEQEQVAELALELGLSPLELKSYSLSLGAPTTLDLVVDKFGPEVEEDEVPEVDEDNEPVSVLGEVYQLGSHRLMCGDSTDEANVIALMGGKKADVVITDPPYNFSDKGEGYFAKQRENVNERIAGIIDFEPSSIAFLADGKYASSYYFFMNKTLLGEYLNLFNNLGSNILVWEKLDAPPMVNNNFLPNIEYILYFYDSSRVWNNGLDIDDYRKVYRSSMNEGRKEGNDEHPTIKPVTLLSKFVKISSKNSVLDLFGGSGSTLIACEQTNRICYMMELDPKYVDVIRKRYAKHIGEEEAWQEVTPAINSLQAVS